MSQPAAKRRKTDKPQASGPTITDSRFANIQSDPRYRLPGRRQKVKVDKRFARALHDDDFSRKARVDRYGRPIDADAEKTRLRRKYDFEEDVDDVDVSGGQSDEPDDEEDVQAELRRVEVARDVLREGRDISSSEDETSSDEEEHEEDDADGVGPGMQDRDVLMGDVSPRLAVVNLDWDNIRAEDLMAVFQSFLPATGRLLKVAVYPSEFGKERLEREEMEGPPKEIFANQDGEGLSAAESELESELEQDDEEIKASLIKPDDGSEFNSTALRQYQLDRLRYFYAVLTFSSPETAKVIYDAVDGTEYLSTANFFDLRFVPDETDFSTDTPREECNRIPPGYKPNEFVTDALQHSKVKLTWDAEDNTRKEAQARAFRAGRSEIDENDLKAYLASDTESDEDGAEDASGSTSKKEAERQRMRALLGLAPEPVKQTKKKDVPLGNIQVTFSSGLSGRADIEGESSDEDGINPKKRSVFENSPEPDETTVEKYIRKERERKQRRKDKMKTNRADTDPEAPQIEGEGQQDMGFNDPFFGDDSTETKSKSKSANKQRKEDRLKRRQEREAEEVANAQQRAELESVMASLNPNSKKTTSDGLKDDKDTKKKNKKKSKKDKRNTNNNNTEGGDESSSVVKIDTSDPRFARLYENHEFAIDPTNPRYRPTETMKAMVEEGRKRRGKKDGARTGETGGNNDNNNTSIEKRTANKKGNEVTNLIEKIKKKQKQK